MQAFCAAAFIGAATAITAETTTQQANHNYLFDYRGYLGNYNSYDRSYGFPVYYPRFDHSEEESTEEERVIYHQYKTNSVNIFTSSDSENNFSSSSNDWSGPSFSSRSGDSASSSGSESNKYSYAGDSASDYKDSVSSSSDHGFSFGDDSSFESEDSDFSSTT